MIIELGTEWEGVAEDESAKFVMSVGVRRGRSVFLGDDRASRDEWLGMTLARWCGLRTGAASLNDHSQTTFTPSNLKAILKGSLFVQLLPYFTRRSAGDKINDVFAGEPADFKEALSLILKEIWSKGVSHSRRNILLFIQNNMFRSWVKSFVLTIVFQYLPSPFFLNHCHWYFSEPVMFSSFPPLN